MNTAAHRSRGSSPVTPTPASSTSELQKAIRHRAEEIYERSGRIEGRDVQNWIQAEAELRSESQSAPRRNAAIVVKVEGVSYVGEFRRVSAAGYTPGEFAKGDPVPIRFEGDQMFVRRRNGKELVTRIVKQAG